MKRITPNYTISPNEGFSGRHLWSKNFLFLRIHCIEPQTICFHTEPPFKNFNPFTDLQRGCICFNWKGNNICISWRK